MSGFTAEEICRRTAELTGIPVPNREEILNWQSGESVMDKLDKLRDIPVRQRDMDLHSLILAQVRMEASTNTCMQDPSDNLSFSLNKQ
jgi:hypothetical protein